MKLLKTGGEPIVITLATFSAGCGIRHILHKIECTMLLYISQEKNSGLDD